MLLIGITTLVLGISLQSTSVTPYHQTRVSALVLVLCLMMSVNPQDLVTLYHALFISSQYTHLIDAVLYIVSFVLLTCISPRNKVSFLAAVRSEYSLMILFSVLGATLLLSSYDLISIYLALELQSFALYILACIYTTSNPGTGASLKYFLLGALSSAFILLGLALIYQVTGTTSFESLSMLLQVSQGTLNIQIGLLCILCGIAFKISAAPFHSWAPDVYNGVPSHVTIVLITLPKISLFTFLYHLSTYAIISAGSITSIMSNIQIGASGFLILVAIFSLVIGTVAGLSQTKLKRLLAFSTISHVGFILLTLTAGPEPMALSSLIFYIIQYTLVTCLTFLVILTYEQIYLGRTVANLTDLQGTGLIFKLLTFTLVICLFSLSGIPPLTGFYAKLLVLNSSILQGQSIIYIIAIICSVISASYYLKIIKILIFNPWVTTPSNIRPLLGVLDINSMQSYIISVLTLFTCLFILDPNLILNSSELVAITYFTALWQSSQFLFLFQLLSLFCYYLMFFLQRASLK